MVNPHNNQKTADASAGPDESNAWVLTTKRVGDSVAGWVIERLYKNNVRRLNASERCEITAFCYPAGAKVVRAKLQRAQT